MVLSTLDWCDPGVWKCQQKLVEVVIVADVVAEDRVGNSWVRTDSVGKFPLNFWLWSVFLKTFNLLYQPLCYDTNTKSIEALCAQFWCHQSSTYSFRSSYPKLFRGTPKAHLTSTVWRPAPSKVRKPRFGQRKKRPFRGVSLADNNFTG